MTGKLLRHWSRMLLIEIFMKYWMVRLHLLIFEFSKTLSK